MPACDGCGLEASNQHRRERIERLELATRHRPIHIQVLFLDSAPPLRFEDFFYHACKDRAARSVGARMYFDELIKTIGSPEAPGFQEETALAEFQRRGFYLAHVVECPVENDDDVEPAIFRMTPKLLVRLQKSYQPKRILLLSQPTHHIVDVLEAEGWKGKLLLDEGGPFFDPFLGDPQNQAEFGTALGDRLSRALSAI